MLTMENLNHKTAQNARNLPDKAGHIRGPEDLIPDVGRGIVDHIFGHAHGEIQMEEEGISGLSRGMSMGPNRRH